MTTQSIFHDNGNQQRQMQSSAFITVAAVCFFVSAIFAGFYFAGSGDECLVDIDDKIKPNHASVASMVRLPNIGPERAKAIIEYRMEGEPFETVADLQKIRGIGPKTVEALSPWVCFE